MLFGDTLGKSNAENCGWKKSILLGFWKILNLFYDYEHFVRPTFRHQQYKYFLLVYHLIYRILSIAMKFCFNVYLK